ncbi:hypothetical protein [Nocardia brasiliensis]|uniref:hypothetical protein n=1 Tax=Nocardia brasiliensis TaxID=37326 RepID=UPI003671BB8B
MSDQTGLRVAQLPLWQRRILEQVHTVAAERARHYRAGRVLLPEWTQWREQLTSIDRFRSELRGRARALRVPEAWHEAVDQREDAGLDWDGALSLPVVDDVRARQLDELERQLFRIDGMSVVAAERGHRRSVVVANATGDEVVDLDNYEQRQFRVNLGQRWVLTTGYADVVGATGAERQQIWDAVSASRVRRARLARTADECTIEDIRRGFGSSEDYDYARKLYDLLVPDPKVGAGGSVPAAFPSPHALLTHAAADRRHHTDTVPDAVDAAIGGEADMGWVDDGSGYTSPARAPAPGFEP